MSIPASDTMVRTTFSIENILPEGDSPLAAAVKEGKLPLTKLKEAMAFVFQIVEDTDKGADVNLKVEDIILVGMKYSDFGLSYRDATVVGINDEIKAVALHPED